jgi:hypothetical protein
MLSYLAVQIRRHVPEMIHPRTELTPSDEQLPVLPIMRQRVKRISQIIPEGSHRHAGSLRECFEIQEGVYPNDPHDLVLVLEPRQWLIFEKVDS